MKLSAFAEELRRLRMNAGPSQEALAVASGVKVGIIKQLESGRQASTAEANVVAFAKALGLDAAATARLVQLNADEDEITIKRGEIEALRAQLRELQRELRRARREGRQPPPEAP